MKTAELIRINQRWADRLFVAVIVIASLAMVANALWFAGYDRREWARNRIQSLRHDGYHTSGEAIFWTDQLWTPETGNIPLSRALLRFRAADGEELFCKPDPMLIDVLTLCEAASAGRVQPVQAEYSGRVEGRAIPVSVTRLSDRSCDVTVRGFEGDPNAAFGPGDLITTVVVEVFALAILTFVSGFLTPTFLGVGDRVRGSSTPILRRSRP